MTEIPQVTDKYAGKINEVTLGKGDYVAGGANGMPFLSFENNSKIQSYLEDNGFEIKDVEFIYAPNDTKEITAEQRETLNKLLDKLDEDDDVSIVFTNVKEEDEE